MFSLNGCEFRVLLRALEQDLGAVVGHIEVNDAELRRQLSTVLSLSLVVKAMWRPSGAMAGAPTISECVLQMPAAKRPLAPGGDLNAGARTVKY